MQEIKKPKPPQHVDILVLTVKVDRGEKSEIDEKEFAWPIDRIVKNIPQITGKQRYDLKVKGFIKYEQDGCFVSISIGPKGAALRPKDADLASPTESVNPS